MGGEVEFEFQTFHSQTFPLLLFLFLFIYLFPFHLSLSSLPFFLFLFPFPLFLFSPLLAYSQCRSSGSRLKSWWNTSSWVPPSPPVVVLFFGQLDACVLPKAPITWLILFLRLSASSLFLFNFLWSNLSWCISSLFLGMRSFFSTSFSFFPAPSAPHQQKHQRTEPRTTTLDGSKGIWLT